jgi:hypothetical protein
MNRSNAKTQLKSLLAWYAPIGAAMAPLRFLYDGMKHVTPVTLDFWVTLLNIFFVTFQFAWGCICCLFAFFFVMGLVAGLAGLVWWDYGAIDRVISFTYEKLIFTKPFGISFFIFLLVVIMPTAFIGPDFQFLHPFTQRVFHGWSGWVQVTIGGLIFCVIYGATYYNLAKWWRRNEAVEKEDLSQTRPRGF